MKLDKDSVPSTIQQAVKDLVISFSEEDKAAIKVAEVRQGKIRFGGVTIVMPKHTNLGYHFASGRSVRNNWSLWAKETPLVQDAIKTYKLAHGDDISSLIFEWAFAIVRGEDFDPHAFAKCCEDYWQAQSGMSALEAGDWKE